MEWIRTKDQYPEPEIPVIAYVQSVAGKFGTCRRIRASWIPPMTVLADTDDEYETGEYDEATDTYYVKGGWYENNEFEDTNWRVDGNVTHWMPLPDPPKEE